jgi:chitinase
LVNLFFKSHSLNIEKLVGYYSSWATYQTACHVTHLNADLCTHLIYAFIGIASSGQINILDPSLDIDRQNFKKFNNLKNSNRSLKTLISVGGHSQGTTNFSIVAASQHKREVFAKEAKDFCQKYGFDGLDVDWEFPSAGYTFIK